MCSQGANEIMPYRVYVPKTYDSAKATPLVIALHGLGGNEDAFFDNTRTCRRSWRSSTGS